MLFRALRDSVRLVCLRHQEAGVWEGWAVQLAARARQDLRQMRKLRGFSLGSRGEIHTTKPMGGLPRGNRSGSDSALLV